VFLSKDQDLTVYATIKLILGRLSNVSQLAFEYRGDKILNVIQKYLFENEIVILVVKRES
jgi:hypothetical protein